MLETVAIVLNERESNKRKVADSLEAELSLIGITSSRFDITSAIEQTIVEAKPKILVVDYLLGDFSTGLDILAKLADLPESDRPATIFLTDEPSVSVAVEAMRLGAAHYIEFNNPRALPAVIDTINKQLKKSKPTAPRQKSMPPLGLKELVAHTKTTRTAIDTVERLAKLSPPLIVMSGAIGTGKRTLSRCLASAMGAPVLKEIDLQTEESPVHQFAKQVNSDKTSLMLGKNLALLIRNCQEDSGEVLEYFTSRFSDFFSKETSLRSSVLIVNTTDPEQADSWVRLTGAKNIHLASLNEEREQDIPPLIQHFTNELNRMTGERIKAPDAKFMTWATKQIWPYNLMELRSVYMNAALSAKASGEDLISCAETLKESWEEEYLSTHNSQLITPLTAARTLEAMAGNFRIAAARLGCSPLALRELISRPNTGEGNGEIQPEETQ